MYSLPPLIIPFFLRSGASPASLRSCVNPARLRAFCVLIAGCCALISTRRLHDVGWVEYDSTEFESLFSKQVQKLVCAKQGLKKSYVRSLTQLDRHIASKTEQDKEKKEKDPKKNKEEKEKKDKGEKKEKKEKGEKKKNPEKVLLKITSLERKLQTLKAQTGETALSKKYETTLFGTDIRCDKDVRVRVGPIIGKVTSTSAIILVEVSLSVELTVHLIPRDKDKPAVHKKQLVPKDRPKGFLVEGLAPNSVYDVAIAGVNAKDAHARTGVVRTFAENPHNLNVVALSCDRPERLLDGETNMWVKLADQVRAGKVDVVLHLGDQVYGQKEFQDAQAVLRYSGHPRGAEGVNDVTPATKRLYKIIKNRMRDIYRFTWNLPGTVTVLSQCSNLMIWSDNDIYNDFTIAKEAGQEGLEPVMLYLAHQVYREYQRQLWDVDYETDNTTDEFFFQRWGSTGVFINDMRGNRITTKGEQRPENPILNDKQWAAFNKFLADPELKNLIVASEIPYVGDTPETAKANAKKPGLEFIVDHWPYNDTELVKLFDLVFEWKNVNKQDRDVVFVGGDIHVGVTSQIKDNKTGIEVVHLTATPISNHVCAYYPKLEGKVNDRYSYSHVPLKDCRNYGLIHAQYAEGKAHLDAKLIAGDPAHH